MVELEKGKFFFGTVKVGTKGQIVIPKKAREEFKIAPGDELIIMGDKKKGLAVIKANRFKKFALGVLEGVNELRSLHDDDGDDLDGENQNQEGKHHENKRNKK